MPCSPQHRQWYIWAYQPRPNSSEPSCGVSSPRIIPLHNINPVSNSTSLPDLDSLPYMEPQLVRWDQAKREFTSVKRNLNFWIRRR